MRKILPIIIMTLVAAALIGGGFYFLRGKIDLTRFKADNRKH